MIKRIWIGFCGLILMSMTACSMKQVYLETGQTLDETECLEKMDETEIKLQKDELQALIYVYVCGYVYSPGVYELVEGDRVYQAIDRAGGMLPEGDSTRMNLAERVTDGQRIYVPSIEEAQNLIETEGEVKSSVDGKVNINQASRDELTVLSGIGESKADAIIAYRQENGPFKTLEELMNVPGIKEGTYMKIKDRISIN